MYNYDENNQTWTSIYACRHSEKNSKWKQKDALLTAMWIAASNLRKHKIIL